MRTSRTIRVVSVVIAAVAIIFAVLPFRASVQPRGSFTYSASSPTHSRCGPAIVDSWHAHDDEGWFGYAPLNGNPPGSRCRSAAQARLGVSGVGIGAAALLFVLAMFIDRRPRFAWLSRLRPAR